MKEKRKPIPETLVGDLLYNSHHMCSICNAMDGRAAQIHHIDGNPSNYNDDNLLVLCLLCHDRVEKEGKLGRKFRKNELLRYRKDWEQKVRETYHPRGDSHINVKQIETMLENHIQKIDMRIVNMPSHQLAASREENKLNSITNILHKIIVKYYRSKQYDDALAICDALEKTSELRELEFIPNISAFCYLRKNEKKKAIEFIELALKKYPNTITTLTNAVSIYMNLNDFNKAENYSKKLIESYPDDVESIILRGHILEHLKQFSEAIGCYDAALRINSKNTHALHHIVDAYFAIKDYKNAIKFNKRLVRLEPKNSNNWYMNGLLNCELGDHLQALKQFSTAESINDTDFSYKHSKIIELKHLKRIYSAKKELSKLLKKQPKNSELLRMRGVINCESQKHSAALKDFESALSIDPNNSQILYSKALELQHLKQDSKSLKVYDKVLKIKPRYVEALINKFTILVKKNPRLALSLLTKALKIDPNHPIGIINMLHVLASKKKYDALELLLSKFAKIEPKSILIPYYRGLIEYNNGNELNALRLFQSIKKNKGSKELLQLAIFKHIRKNKKFETLFE